MAANTSALNVRHLATASGIAAVSMGVLNLVVYLVGLPMVGGEVIAPTPAGLQAVLTPMVVGLTVVAILVGAVLYGVLLRFMGANAHNIYLGVGIVVFLAMFGPFFQEGFSAGAHWLLGVTHGVAFLGAPLTIWLYRRNS